MIAHVSNLIQRADNELRMAHWTLEKLQRGEAVLKPEIHEAMTHLRNASAAMQSVENAFIGMKLETRSK